MTTAVQLHTGVTHTLSNITVQSHAFVHAPISTEIELEFCYLVNHVGCQV